MAVVKTCDPCDTWGFPGEDLPGALTVATGLMPVLTRVKADDQDDDAGDGWAYTVRMVDVCDEHKDAWTNVQLRLALSIPGDDLVTGWEPEEPEEPDFSDAPWVGKGAEEHGEGGGEPETGEEGEGEEGVPDLGMDEDDAQAVREHLAENQDDTPPLTGAAAMRAKLMARVAVANPEPPKPAATAPKPAAKSNGGKLNPKSNAADIVRTWAKGMDIPVKDKGRIAGDVYQQFYDADPSHKKYFTIG